MMKKSEVINCASFNSTNTLVALGTHSGFSVFNLEKFSMVYETLIDGGVGLISMFEYSNLFALRGSAYLKYEEKNKVVLYDAKSRKICAVVGFEMSIKSLCLTKGYLLVSSQTRTFLYTVSPGRLNFLMDFQTNHNQHGAFDMQVFNDETHLAVPLMLKEFPDKGIVAIRILERFDNPSLIRAFKEEIDFLKFDREMRRIVAYSSKISRIRIFEISNGKLLQQLVKDFASPISSLDFSPNNKFLLVCDTNSDVEIFNTKGLEQKDKDELNTNRKSMFSFLSNIIPYFRNEWNFSTTRNTSTNSTGKGYFINNTQFTVISYSGHLIKHSFDILHGGDCFIEEKISDFIQ